jgi:hypothetical protein
MRWETVCASAGVDEEEAEERELCNEGWTYEGLVVVYAGVCFLGIAQAMMAICGELQMSDALL